MYAEISALQFIPLSQLRVQHGAGREKPLIMKLLKTRTQCKQQQTARLNWCFSPHQKRIDPRFAYKDNLPTKCLGMY